MSSCRELNITACQRNHELKLWIIQLKNSQPKANPATSGPCETCESSLDQSLMRWKKRWQYRRIMQSSSELNFCSRVPVWKTHSESIHITAALKSFLLHMKLILPECSSLDGYNSCWKFKNNCICSISIITAQCLTSWSLCWLHGSLMVTTRQQKVTASGCG